MQCRKRLKRAKSENIMISWDDRVDEIYSNWNKQKRKYGSHKRERNKDNGCGRRVFTYTLLLPHIQKLWWYISNTSQHILQNAAVSTTTNTIISSSINRKIQFHFHFSHSDMNDFINVFVSSNIILWFYGKQSFSQYYRNVWLYNVC